VEERLKLIKLREYLHGALILAIMVLMWGCGGGGGTTPNVAVSKGASVSVIPSGSGVYVIQGDNMDGVAGIELTINYDNSALSSPTVTQGGLISGALMVANIPIPGTIKIAVVSTTPFSGSGQIAAVSFATVTGTASVTLSSVKMVDINGAPVQ
jgi:hypothetical protein